MPERAATTPTPSTSRSTATISPEPRGLRLQHWPHLPRRLRSAQVLVRFGVRLLVLVAFASVGSIAFESEASMALFWMATILCAVDRRSFGESGLRHDLNHWDEMVAYGGYVR